MQSKFTTSEVMKALTVPNPLHITETKEYRWNQFFFFNTPSSPPSSKQNNIKCKDGVQCM